MASRNRTLVFIQFRNEKKSMKSNHSSYKSDSSKSTLLGKGKYEDNEDDIELGTVKMKPSIPPGWMSVIDDVKYDISKIKQNTEKLADHHKSRLMISFEDSGKDEQSIQVLTEYITKLFHDCQSKIQKICPPKSDEVLSPEAQEKKNVQSSLALELQELSTKFRSMQREYLQKLRGRQTRGRILEDDDDEEDKYDIGFTPEQIHTLQNNVTNVQQRDKDVKQIVKSITELAEIFKDLSVLVIEQGTILDRIDYNIEQTSVTVEEATKQLGGANELQKGQRKKLCIMLLCLCILIMIVAVIMKGLIPGI